MISRERATQLIRYEPYKIGHYMGFQDLTELHNEWLKSFLFNPNDQTLQAHRGSYKTTCVSLGLACSIVIRPWELIDFFRKTDTDTVEVVKQTKNILQSGAMFDIARAITGVDLLITKDSKNEIDTTLHQGIGGTPQLRGMGLGSSITGKHGDLIVTDDIVNINDRVSAAERERTKLAYMELQNIKNRGGRFINTGTPWHKDDAFTLMPNIKKYDCYQTGLMSEAEIEYLKTTMSHSLFAANYELKHIADEDAMFTEPKYTSDEELLYDGIAHIDAAYGGEDSTAFTIVKLRGGILYAYGKKYDKHVDNCIDEILALKERFRAGRTYVEKNADKGYLQKELKRRGDLATAYDEGMNKYIKISSYLKGIWHKVVFLDTTDPEYVNQILEYNEHAAHDDCPDSLACMARLLWDKMNKDDYKPLYLDR